MLVIDPKNTPIPALHQYLVGSIGPRPIAFASTMDQKGRSNLAPYSFFNVFSSNPPVLIFSSNRKVKDNTTKDTLHNIQEAGEVVINVVNYAIVRQMAICSISFPKEISEFKKSGLTPIASDLVAPFRVKESPVQFECKVREILPLGQQGGAGNLIICDILRIHIAESILDDQGKINPHKIDLMGRLGRAFYTRASGEAIYSIYQPVDKIGIGYDALPRSAQKSTILTGNNLGQIASILEKPSEAALQKIRKHKRIQNILNAEAPISSLHKLAQKELAKENVELAAKIVWIADALS